MVRTFNRLTASKVAVAKGPRTFSDGGRLYLQVDINHRKRWLFIYARHGKQREIALGPYPSLSLADARVKRDQMNTALAKGEPLAGPRQQGAETFGAIAAQVVKRRAAAWRGKESARHWRISLEAHCVALLDRPIASITAEDVLRLLSSLHDRAPNFAQITRARIEEVFDFAMARGLIAQDKANPADQRRLRMLLPKKPKAVARPALPYAHVPALIVELQAIPLADRRVVAARALEFVILTALRVGEACGATLSEIDFDKRILAVPANRMKAGLEHQVPLCERAIEIVRELEVLRGKDGVVFASRAKAIDGDRLNALLKTLRPGITVHGFRSSFRDWAGDETMFPREVCEAALAHVIGGVEGSYRRGSALEKRRELMEMWARFCCGEETGKVIALRR